MALDEAGLKRKLVGGQTHRLFGELRGNAFHLEQDAAGANNADPMIGGTLTFTHTGFSRLLGNGLVREQTEPDLAATFDETRHCDTAGFDLPVGDVTALHDLEAVVAERKIGAAPRFAGHTAALLLAKLDLLWHQHKKTLFTLSGMYSPKTPATPGKWLRRERTSGEALIAALLLLVDVPAVNPGLDADDAVGGVRLGKTVIDVGAQGVQRQTTLEIPLGAGDLVSVETTGDADLDALAAGAESRVDRFAHGATEADALLELERNVLGDKLSVELGLVDLEDVDKHLARCPLLDIGLELVDLCAFAADDDARTRRANDQAQLVSWALNLDRTDACSLQLLA